jgi:hypothetical protein
VTDLRRRLAAVLRYLVFRPINVGPHETASYDDAVAVRSVENVPIAELLIGQLRGEGIEAFYKVSGGILYPGSGAHPLARCDIYVSRRDAERARELIPAD